MSIKESLKEIHSQLPSSVHLVCISKFQPEAAIMEAYDAGERIFGESRTQELCIKYENLPKDIQWHFIGHLQTNKIKYILPFVDLIHSVDSLKLLNEINKQAKKINKTVNCLLQVHIAQEETKFGFNPDELIELFKGDEWQKWAYVKICGLMGMATFTDNTTQIRNEFRGLKKLFDLLKNEYFNNDNSFSELSMGMSNDYLIAVEEGSTMVRLGTSIFGERK